MKIMTRMTHMFFLTILVFSLAGIPGAMAADSQDSVVEQVIQRGVLRVGMSTFVPWAMKDKTGKLIGFEIAVRTSYRCIIDIRNGHVDRLCIESPASIGHSHDRLVYAVTIGVLTNFKIGGCFKSQLATT